MKNHTSQIQTIKAQRTRRNRSFANKGVRFNSTTRPKAKRAFSSLLGQSKILQEAQLSKKIDYFYKPYNCHFDIGVPLTMKFEKWRITNAHADKSPDFRENAKLKWHQLSEFLMDKGSGANMRKFLNEVNPQLYKGLKDLGEHIIRDDLGSPVKRPKTGRKSRFSNRNFQIKPLRKPSKFIGEGADMLKDVIDDEISVAESEVWTGNEIERRKSKIDGQIITPLLYISRDNRKSQVFPKNQTITLKMPKKRKMSETERNSLVPRKFCFNTNVCSIHKRIKKIKRHSDLATSTSKRALLSLKSCQACKHSKTIKIGKRNRKVMLKHVKSQSKPIMEKERRLRNRKSLPSSKFPTSELTTPSSFNYARNFGETQKVAFHKQFKNINSILGFTEAAGGVE